jgi:hypothetical protein
MDVLNPSNVCTPNTFGPAFDIQQDGNRLMSQMDTIAALMLKASAVRQWLTLTKSSKRQAARQPVSPLSFVTFAKRSSERMRC